MQMCQQVGSRRAFVVGCYSGDEVRKLTGRLAKFGIEVHSHVDGRASGPLSIPPSVDYFIHIVNADHCVEAHANVMKAAIAHGHPARYIATNKEWSNMMVTLAKHGVGMHNPVKMTIEPGQNGIVAAANAMLEQAKANGTFQAQVAEKVKEFNEKLNFANSEVMDLFATAGIESFWLNTPEAAEEARAAVLLLADSASPAVRDAIKSMQVKPTPEGLWEFRLLMVLDGEKRMMTVTQYDLNTPEYRRAIVKPPPKPEPKTEPAPEPEPAQAAPKPEMESVSVEPVEESPTTHRKATLPERATITYLALRYGLTQKELQPANFHTSVISDMVHGRSVPREAIPVIIGNAVAFDVSKLSDPPVDKGRMSAASFAAKVAVDIINHARGATRDAPEIVRLRNLLDARQIDYSTTRERRAEKRQQWAAAAEAAAQPRRIFVPAAKPVARAEVVASIRGAPAPVSPLVAQLRASSEVNSLANELRKRAEEAQAKAKAAEEARKVHQANANEAVRIITNALRAASDTGLRSATVTVTGKLLGHEPTMTEVEMIVDSYRSQAGLAVEFVPPATIKIAW